MIRLFPKLNPITRKRLQRFREMRRARWSLWILLLSYAISLFAELLCNDKPLFALVDGRVFFPAFRSLLAAYLPEWPGLPSKVFYSRAQVLGTDENVAINFKALKASPDFKASRGDRMIFPPVPFGPNESISPAELSIANETQIIFRPDPRVLALNVDASGRIVTSIGEGSFIPAGASTLEAAGLATPDVLAAIKTRLANTSDAAHSHALKSANGTEVRCSLSAFAPRAIAPQTVRILLRFPAEEHARTAAVVVDRAGALIGGPPELWARVGGVTTALLASARARFDGYVPSRTMEIDGVRYQANFEREAGRFPFRPCTGHALGIDSAGRDVLARILYGLRVSMTFGMVLVFAAIFVGTLVGGLQGFYGGWIDLSGQRLIEVWQALPFLYIIMLLGSIYGQSFMLLLVVDALFGWIGISFYMRAEFLRLRKWSFVEAARTQGLGDGRIMFGHILPNALVPLITFFPFSLVGAIGLLAALDFLGFGLPPPTPSWGEMLSQGHENLWGWWLITYPSIALFVVMLLCVFVGEGLRAAFDPKAYSKME